MLRVIGAILWTLIFCWIVLSELALGAWMAFRVLFLGHTPPEDDD